MSLEKYLQDKFSIKLKDNHYLEKALTHPSYANEVENESLDHYERLEFIGDAILEFVISEYIFNKFPHKDEGDLTIIRSKAVREESLASYAKTYDIAQYIKMGKGELKTGGNFRDSIQANVFEAIIGAIYLSNGLDDVKKFLQVTFEAIDNDDFEELEDYKTKLQEYVQSDKRQTVIYDLIESTGSANAPTFTFNVKIDDLILGTGSGTSKKKAQQAAAKDALEKMAKTL